MYYNIGYQSIEKCFFDKDIKILMLEYIGYVNEELYFIGINCKKIIFL